MSLVQLLGQIVMQNSLMSVTFFNFDTDIEICLNHENVLKNLFLAKSLPIHHLPVNMAKKFTLCSLHTTFSFQTLYQISYFY